MASRTTPAARSDQRHPGTTRHAAQVSARSTGLDRRPRPPLRCPAARRARRPPWRRGSRGAGVTDPAASRGAGDLELRRGAAAPAEREVLEVLQGRDLHRQPVGDRDAVGLIQQIQVSEPRPARPAGAARRGRPAWRRSRRPASGTASRPSISTSRSCPAKRSCQRRPRASFSAVSLTATTGASGPASRRPGSARRPARWATSARVSRSKFRPVGSGYDRDGAADTVSPRIA